MHLYPLLARSTTLHNKYTLFHRDPQDPTCDSISVKFPTQMIIIMKSVKHSGICRSRRGRGTDGMVVNSGGSRISQGRGAPTTKVGAPPIIWSKNSRKLHENEIIWAQREGRASPVLPSPDPLMVKTRIHFNLKSLYH